MTSWLMKNSITFGEKMLKSDLRQLINTNKPVHRTYNVDSIFSEDGHTISRLPLYHSELNPN
jgi:hypothetical protein